MTVLTVASIAAVAGCDRSCDADPLSVPFTQKPSPDSMSTTNPSPDADASEYWTEERMRDASAAPMPVCDP